MATRLKVHIKWDHYPDQAFCALDLSNVFSALLSIPYNQVREWAEAGESDKLCKICLKIYKRE